MPSTSIHWVDIRSWIYYSIIARIRMFVLSGPFIVDDNDELHSKWNTHTQQAVVPSPSSDKQTNKQIIENRLFICSVQCTFENDSNDETNSRWIEKKKTRSTKRNETMQTHCFSLIRQRVLCSLSFYFDSVSDNWSCFDLNTASASMHFPIFEHLFVHTNNRTKTNRTRDLRTHSHSMHRKSAFQTKK